jgi:hypothetical protein
MELRMLSPAHRHITRGRHAARTRRTRELVDLAQKRFFGCDVCRHNDSYEWVDDLLGSLRLRKRERGRLFRALTCPRCESQVHPGTFVLGADRRELRRLAFSKRFDEIYKTEMEEFREFLLRHPMLGATRPFGKLLVRAVNRAKKTKLEPGLWFRATTDTNETNLGPRPREGAARAHRFNQIGQVAWYLGQDARTAAVEALREPRPSVQIAMQTAKILEPVYILDLRLPFLEPNPTEGWILREVIARGFFSEPTDDIDESQPQYRAPQYIADLARKRGFRGILYDSTRPSAYNNPEAWGTNLVLFDPVPARELTPVGLMEFGEADFDIFSMDRWPLQPIPTTG